ncbi:hypothetical protein ACLKA7_000889, partial [Drosophila subpalustris]
MNLAGIVPQLTGIVPRPNTTGKSTICDWYSNFKRGRTSTEDSKRSGRPKEVIITELL